MVKYSLSSVSKKWISRKQLKEDMRNGRLETCDGMITYEQLKELYPNELDKLDCNLDYYKAIQATAGNWKNGARDIVEKLDKHLLVNQIRKLEAENYSLKEKIKELEMKLK